MTTFTAFFWPLSIGFSLALIAGAILLSVLKRTRMAQYAYEDAPQTHRVKTGTPTMGGLVFLVALVPLLCFRDAPFARALYLLVLACAAIGFVDDFLAIRLGRNRGLRARTKFLATALIAIVFLRNVAPVPRGVWPLGVAGAPLPNIDVIFHAGAFGLHVPHWFWLLLGIVAITGTIHAVNLTDGLDGLAGSTIIWPLAALGFIALQFHLLAPAWGALLGIGACLGFLVYNWYPAKMFMGDTGSLALGALLSGVAILSGEMLLLVLVGGVFVAEALSVIVQVAYFKLTHGKRVFRMTPLHHHFELGGWAETKVTARFWLASAVLSLAGLAIVR
ncbi:MAG: phospho-N-acetylmuramoyl-pentapeptide-transferase [Candidatus Eremiobacteraeota bacterium]|nr:phospho-N-acetylmuramoyl-pentapeptide-transferase [Candidatus Eremiobacteraeota bacterium]